MGTEYEYIFTSVDPDGDDVYYWILWFDGCPGIYWERPYNSGQTVGHAYTYENQGNYSITAKAKDEFGAESDWATLEESMPKNKMINPFERFLDNHPYIFTLLQHLSQNKSL